MYNDSWQTYFLCVSCPAAINRSMESSAKDKLTSAGGDLPRIHDDPSQGRLSDNRHPRRVEGTHNTTCRRGSSVRTSRRCPCHATHCMLHTQCKIVTIGRHHFHQPQGIADQRKFRSKFHSQWSRTNWQLCCSIFYELAAWGRKRREKTCMLCSTHRSSSLIACLTHRTRKIFL